MAEARRGIRLVSPLDELLKVIDRVEPCGVSLHDILYLVKVALSDPSEDAQEAARAKIAAKLVIQAALLSVYKSSVVNRAKDLGHGTLKFMEAASILGDEFKTLRDVYTRQLNAL